MQAASAPDTSAVLAGSASGPGRYRASRTSSHCSAGTGSGASGWDGFDHACVVVTF